MKIELSRDEIEEILYCVRVNSHIRDEFDPELYEKLKNYLEIDDQFQKMMETKNRLVAKSSI